MTFRRYLSSNAVLESARARWGAVLVEWSCTLGATVHLRRSDEIAFYHLGHRALSIRGAGAEAPIIEAWQGQPVVDAQPTTLREALARARASIEEHRAAAPTATSARPKAVTCSGCSIRRRSSGCSTSRSRSPPMR